MEITEGQITAIRYELDKKRNGANSHRISREMHRVDIAWKRYKTQPTPRRLADLEEDIKIAKAQVW